MSKKSKKNDKKDCKDCKKIETKIVTTKKLETDDE